jgi:hypothetical protein
MCAVSSRRGEAICGDNAIRLDRLSCRLVEFVAGEQVKVWLWLWWWDELWNLGCSANRLSFPSAWSWIR